MPVETDIEITNKDIYPCLQIGLGGTGVKVLKKLKEQFIAKSKHLIAEDGGSVLFYGLDTEPYSREAHDPLTKGEFKSLGIDVRPSRFVKENMEAEGDHGIKSVWPDSLTNGKPSGEPYELPGNRKISSGASQNRLIGRVALFSEAGTVVTRISSIIKKFFQLEKVKVDEATSAQIHVIGSIAGGTGSSLIFDVPYLCKLAADKENRNIFITGHFVMSGAFDSVLAGSPAEQEKCAANTYTCLKELDYYYRTYARNSGKGEALWEVKYTRGVGTIEPDGFPHDVAKQTPMDWVNLYDKTNEHDASVTNPDHMFDIIAQGISYGINGGVNRKSISAIDNALDKTLELTTNGKAKPYCSMGVSTLEIPTRALTQYMAYRWVEDLCTLKARHPYQKEDTDEDKAVWAVMKQFEFEQLQNITLPVCQVKRLNSAGKWDKTDNAEKEFKRDWPKLAEAYGLKKIVTTGLSADISATIMADYERGREKLAKHYVDKGEKIYGEYEAEIKSDLKAVVEKIKTELRDTLDGLGDYQFTRMEKNIEEPILRSTDAYKQSAAELALGLDDIKKIVDEAEQRYRGLSDKHERAGAPDKLKEKKMHLMGAGPRSGQVQDWAENAKQAVLSKAAHLQAKLLSGTLEELRIFINVELKQKCEKADDLMDEFSITAKAKADRILQLQRGDENSKAVSVFLIEADNFPQFVSGKKDVRDDKADDIWARTKALIDESKVRCKPTLLETLNAGRDKLILGKNENEEQNLLTIKAERMGYLERACFEVADATVRSLSFRKFVTDTYINTGNEAKLHELVQILVKKGGAWMSLEAGAGVADAQDAIKYIDYLLYPDGAEDIAEFLNEMKDDGTLGNDNVAITEMPPGVTEGIVKVSMRLGFALDTLESFEEYKRNEEKMASTFPNVLRSIISDYHRVPFPCPLDAYEGPDTIMTTLVSSDFDKAGKLFIMAHAYSLIKETRVKGEDKWVFAIEDRINNTQHRELPGNVKVSLSYIKTNEGGIPSETVRKLYLASKDEPESMLKLAGAIMAQEDLQTEIHNAETKWRKETKEKNPEAASWIDRDFDRELFQQYLQSPQFRGLETAGKKYSEQEAKYLRSLVAIELG